MRVVFDTNILVLYLIGGGPAKSILKAALLDIPEKPLSFFYSPDMMTEYTETLNKLPEKRPDIFFPQDIAALLRDVAARGRLVYPTITLTGNPDACSHEPDNRFLECAAACRANYIVTVNTRHFPDIFRGIKTVAPSQFYEIVFVD